MQQVFLRTAVSLLVWDTKQHGGGGGGDDEEMGWNGVDLVARRSTTFDNENTKNKIPNV